MPDSKLDIDRASGLVHAHFRLSHPEVRLAEVTSFALGEAKRGLGRGARVETTHGIVAITRGGETRLTEFTADPATIARFRGGIVKLEAFRTGTEPSLSLSFEVQESRAARANNAGTIVLLGIIVIVAVSLYFMFRRG